jgi:hypothetical protein
MMLPRYASQARELIARGDIMEARRILFLEGDDTPLGNEIDSLLFAGMYDEAVRRLDVALYPKFESPAECRKAYDEAMQCA